MPEPFVLEPDCAVMLICQISDLHIKTSDKLSYGVVDTSSMFKRCVEHILALTDRKSVV